MHRKHSFCIKTGVFICLRSGGYFRAFGEQAGSGTGQGLWESQMPLSAVESKASVIKGYALIIRKSMGTSKCQPLEARIFHKIENCVSMEWRLKKSASRDIGEDGSLIHKVVITYKTISNPFSSLMLKEQREAWRSWLSLPGVLGPRGPLGLHSIALLPFEHFAWQLWIVTQALSHH